MRFPNPFTAAPLLALLAALAARPVLAQPRLPAGVLVKEFVFEQAPFPSCHASTIEQLPDGSLVAAWFGGTDEGEGDVCVWLSRNDNKGGGWSAPVEVADGVAPSQNNRRFPCWNPVLFRPPGDAPLLLFYKVGPNPEQWWGMLITSGDGGRTWSPPQRLPEGFLGPIKNKPVLLRDGTLLCGSSTEPGGWRVHMETSPDLGRTWTKTGPLNDVRTVEAIQPALLAAAPGTDGPVRILCRTKQGRVAQSRSRDGGRTWDPLKLTDLPNPNSGIDAVTLKDGRGVLVYNHTRHGRSPLNVAVTAGDGDAWRAGPVLEDEPGEYSYPAVIQTGDGLVHITYTWKRRKIRHVVLDPAKLDLADLPAVK